MIATNSARGRVQAQRRYQRPIDAGMVLSPLRNAEMIGAVAQFRTVGGSGTLLVHGEGSGLGASLTTLKLEPCGSLEAVEPCSDLKLVQQQKAFFDSQVDGARNFELPLMISTWTSKAPKRRAQYPTRESRQYRLHYFRAILPILSILGSCVILLGTLSQKNGYVGHDVLHLHRSPGGVQKQ